MSIFTKVLLGLVLIMTFPVLYLAAGVLNVQGAWRVKHTAFEKQLAAQEAEKNKLIYGSEDAQKIPKLQNAQVTTANEKGFGVNQLEAIRNNLVTDAGRVWYAVLTQASVSPETNSLKIKIFDTDVDNPRFTEDPATGGRAPLPDHGIVEKTSLHVFQMAHNGVWNSKDRYVGEFVVEGTIDVNVPLKPARALTPEQWDLLRTEPTQWVVYDKMPVDTRDLFLDVDQAEIRRRLPAEVAIEYINDNKEPSAEILADPNLSKLVEGSDAGGKRFLRQLRDYSQIFQAGRERLDKMADSLRYANSELAFAKAARMDLEEIKADLDKTKARLDIEKAAVDADLKIVLEHQVKLTEAVAEMKQELARLLAESKRRKDPAAAPAAGKTAAVPAPEAGAALAP